MVVHCEGASGQRGRLAASSGDGLGADEDAYWPASATPVQEKSGQSTTAPFAGVSATGPMRQPLVNCAAFWLLVTSEVQWPGTVPLSAATRQV